MRDLSAVLDRHERIVLQFSGGKDSLACLGALEPWWPKIVVAWGNRGADYPETLQTIAYVRTLPVEFVEVHAPLPHEMSMRVHGYPADVIPLRNVEDFAHLSQQPLREPRIQTYMACCNRMLFEPLDRFCREYGATLIVRGQRLAEQMRSPVRDGDVIDGVEYLFPIEDMTDEQVIEYLEATGWTIPEHYLFTEKSLDCWSCTAYMHESRDRLIYTEHTHPDLWRRLVPRLRAVQAAVRSASSHLDDAVRLTEGDHDELR